MAYAINQGVRIHYQVEGDGPPLVLQHGLFWRLEGWSRVGYVDALKPHYQLVLIDARGHGASDKPHDGTAYTLPQHVRDITAVLDALDISTAHFWGYSMGGWFGFGMAKYAAARVNSLIIGGAHPYERRLPVASRPDGADPEAFVGAFFQRMGLDRAALSPAEAAEFFDNDFRALAASLQDRPSLEDILPTMTMPCLLYVGELDGVFPQVEACVEHIPRGSLVSFPAVNHPEAFYRAELVLPHAMEFLQAVAEG
jgi:pimeloyl-ACP methyl ester carboxylesterase